MGAFFHGVKIVEKSSGARPINIVRPGVIGLVGTAPSWAVASPDVAPAINTPTLVGSGLDAEMFGPLIQGYSIPYALAAILAQALPGATPQVIVINVFDPTRHATTLTSQAFTFPGSGAQVISLGHMGISSGATPGKPVVKNTGGSTTYAEGTDYSVDYFNGTITAIGGGTLTTGQAVKVTFSYNDPSLVTDADIIGTISGGNYTGIQALEQTYQMFGYFPKILAAHNSDMADVSAAMITMANTIRARALIDCAASTTRATAISNRSTGGQAFDTSSYRADLCAPRVKFTDNGIVPTGITLSTAGAPIVAIAGTTGVQRRSYMKAGLWSALVSSIGPWESPSNLDLVGALGPDVTMYMNPFDANSDSELLNAAGIDTIMQSFATGIREWGNRSAAFPSNTDPAVFNCIRLMMDVIEDSEVESMLQFIDQPLTAATIDAIIESINGFLRGFIQQGGLIDGNCSFNAAENPVLSLEAGTLVLDDEFMPPPPLEQLILNTSLQPDFLSELASEVAATQTQ